MRLTLRVQWDRLHFCKDDKVRYRKHLTVGMFVATLVGMIGTFYDNAWLINVAGVANFVTAVWWIWE